MTTPARLLVLTPIGLIVALLGLLAPWLCAEYSLRQHDVLVAPAPAVAVRGRWFDDYFVVEPIDNATFAIGEPRYYQANYSYLIVGSRRAVLFDAGTGNGDIVPVVHSLTALPVTAIPSHLHFDHVGALGRLQRTALVDLPALRTRSPQGSFEPSRYEFLGFADSLPVPRLRIDEWWLPDSVVDLGGREIRVLSTPGHTPSSVALYDVSRHQLFVGDFLYPGPLYAFLPGASRSAYLATARRLLATLDPATRLYTAHMQEDASTVAAPVLEVADLAALAETLAAIEDGTARASGFYPRVFPVRGAISFATGWPWNNR